MSKPLVSTTLYTLAALLAFAGNSVLCRLAIGAGKIDPLSFTLIRIVSGALVLALLVKITTSKTEENASGSWFAASMLLFYAIAFSFAYTLLDTGVGALVLFGVVQISMVLYGVLTGELLSRRKALGVIGAFFGLVFLISPTLDGATASISGIGFFLMALAGASWAVYTLLGKTSTNPLVDTADNFLKASLLSALLLIPLLLQTPRLSSIGIILSIASGAIMSGLGYTVWYKVLPRITSIQSGVVQLSVPLLAAFGGVIFVGEPFTRQLMVAMAITLSGIFVVMSAPVTSVVTKQNKG